MDELQREIEGALADFGADEVLVLVLHPHTGVYHMVVADNGNWDVACCGATAGLDWIVIHTPAPWQLVCDDCLQGMGRVAQERQRLERIRAAQQR